MGLFDWFKNTASSKKEWVDAELNELAPYQNEINNNRDILSYLIPHTIWTEPGDELKSNPKLNVYDKIIELMINVDDEFIEHNINKIIIMCKVRSKLKNKYNEETYLKIEEKIAWIGMTNSMFNDSLLLLTTSSSSPGIYSHEIKEEANGIYKYYKFNKGLSISYSKLIVEMKFKNDKLYEMVDLSTWSKNKAKAKMENQGGCMLTILLGLGFISYFFYVS